MAYYSNPFDPEQRDGYGQGQSGGILGGSGAGATGLEASPAPKSAGTGTNSGMQFVNLQRYLQQNQGYDAGKQIQDYANKTTANTNSAYDSATMGGRNYLKSYAGTANSPYTDKDIFDSARNYGQVGSSTQSPTRDLKPAPNILTGQGYEAPGEIKYEEPQQFQRLMGVLQSPWAGSTPGKPYSLFTESGLVQNPAGYTPGMEALDLGLTRASPDSWNTINSVQKSSQKLVDDHKQGIQSLNKDVANTAKGMEAKRQGALTRARQLFDQGAAGSSPDDVGLYQNLAKILGLDPNIVGSKGRTKVSEIAAGGKQPDGPYTSPVEENYTRLPNGNYTQVKDIEAAPYYDPRESLYNQVMSPGGPVELGASGYRKPLQLKYFR